MLDLRQCALGIEFGSTRIKAVLVDGSHAPVAQGDFTWENQLKDGVWTYPLEAVHTGLQHAYAALAADVQAKYGCYLAGKPQLLDFATPEVRASRVC